jgi:hypothetical protein
VGIPRLPCDFQERLSAATSVGSVFQLLPADYSASLDQWLSTFVRQRPGKFFFCIRGGHCLKKYLGPVPGSCPAVEKHCSRLTGFGRPVNLHLASPAQLFLPPVSSRSMTKDFVPSWTYACFEMGPPLRRGRDRIFYAGATFVAL